ncbi:MAG: (d)CMP kinase [Chloroflexota bacterium]|nr:(d)CMP kinase [Chloroflexota bacterium]
MSLPSTITVDGPAASGKSTIGGLLAERLGYLYFDTGALYRAITWLALERGLAIDDEEAIVALAQAAQITITKPTVQDGRQYTVYADSRDITWEIRSPEVDSHVSPVSAYPGVREALKATQRQIGEGRQVVMVGRDIGTVILPHADLKIYLDASLEVRAQRRHKEILTRGEEASYEDILADMRRRDEIDSHRLAAPLRPAKDAIIINTDHLSIEEVFGQVMAQVEKWRPLEEG